MSEPIKLNSGGVTTLADTDRVVGCDSTGALRSISMANLLAQIRSSIHIGGRNLLRNSGSQISNNSYNMGSLYYADAPIAGTEVTVTIWGELGADRTRFSVFNGYGEGTYGFSHLRKVEDGKHQGTFTILKPADRITIYAMPQDAISGSSVKRIKLERGNIPTDWSPAPEDLSGGGVKRYASISCKLQQKGGQRDGGSDNTDRGIVEEPVADRFGGQRRMYEYRFGYDPRDIYDFCRYHGNFPCKDGSLRPLWQTYCLPEAKRQYIPDAHRRKRSNGNQSLLQRFMAALERASVPVAIGKEVAA